tara:strand:- start:64 stop:1077 length:1014 start_codon:yes stop_codon:yes gene_type:complete
MLIVMKPEHTEEQLSKVVEEIHKMEFKAHVLPGKNSVAIGITGNVNPISEDFFTTMHGVHETIKVTKPFKLAGKEFSKGNLEIKVGPVTFDDKSFVIMAGPCAVESEEQTIRIAKKVKAAGAHILRGGAYKPRSSPYAFQGMGIEGLKILQKASKETGLPVITEALDFISLEGVVEYADIIQIGTRNMQNFSLLQEVGKTNKPVMLKRGFSATIEEWLMAAEYILDSGNPNVILCERGLRSYDQNTRNLLDITAVPVAKQLSRLPVVIDPSHSTGRKYLVEPVSRASLAIGANGIIVDVHDKPHEALVDGPQALLPDEFIEMVKVLKSIGKAIDINL